MRISDWRSCVCSSDLVASKGRLRATGGNPRNEFPRRSSDSSVSDHQSVLLATFQFRFLHHTFSCSQPSYKDQRSEEHTSELQSLMRTSYDVLCLQKTNKIYHEIDQSPIALHLQT